MNKRKPKRLTCVVSVALCLLACSAAACNVPVFRYALQWWHPDPYRVTILQSGDLPADQTNLVAQLTRMQDEYYGAPALFLETVDVAAGYPASLTNVWATGRPPHLPWLLFRYPERYGIEEPLWSAPFTAETCALLTDSPARETIAKGLIEGDSAVWVFIRGGNEEKDRTAYTTLTNALAEMEEELELPEPVDGDLELGYTPDVKIRFSTVDFDRGDPREALLEKTVRTVEEAVDGKEPLAFPVFGRGRILWALIGDGITTNNIGETCFFLTGPCSCQVKYGNPGYDAFIPIDWESLVEYADAPGEELPPLTTPLALLAPPEPAGATNQAPQPEEPLPSSGSPLARNLVVTGVIALAAIAVVSAVMLRRTGGGR